MPDEQIDAANKPPYISLTTLLNFLTDGARGLSRPVSTRARWISTAAEPKRS